MSLKSIPKLNHFVFLHFSLPQLTPKGKQEVMDPKKKKKFEKEEKEFRKKFKVKCLIVTGESTMT